MSRTVETILRLKGESEYRTGLKNCSTEMKVLKSELSLVGSQFRTNANSMEALTAKGDVLTKMYANQEQKVALLRGALEKAQQTQDAEQKTVAELQEKYQQAKKRLDEFGDSVDQTSEEYKQAKAETENLQNALAKHQIRLESATGAISKYSIQLNRAEVDLHTLADKQEENNRLLNEAKASADGCATSIDQYGDTVREASDSMAGAGSAVEALAGQMVATGLQQKVEDLAAAMMDASEAAQEYELSIAQVTTIADSNVLSKSAASSEILKLSTDLRKDATEVAEAAYSALSAGVDTANVLNFTAQASQLATAGFTDTATSVDVLTTIMNAYKMEADQTEKVASTLVKTQDLGKITVDQLAKQIGRVIPSAAAYGVNLDNIATAYAHMTASGISAENSTTYLTTMLDELSNSGKDVASILEEETGKSFAELMASGKSLGDVLDILGQSVDGDKVKFSNLWGSATAGKAAISLLNTGAEQFNLTLNEMANSSGTVAANYKKMTDVSDYASQRLTVANKNLSIIIGGQLNPVLDKLRNAGAGILEMAADVISSNPALVSVISGLVTSLGLLTTGLSALMIVKSVTAAMQALNITMLANPAVLIATGVAGLVAALATFCAQASDASSQVDALTESAQKLNERTVAGAKAYTESVAAVESTYSVCDIYISRLEALEAQGKLTGEQQAEYNALVDEVATLIPDLNIELDEETGLLKGGAAALREQADGWRKAAIAEAAYTRYKDDVAAMVEAEYELAENKVKLDVATKKLEATQTRQTEVLSQMSAKGAEYDAVLSDYSLSSDEAAHRSSVLLAEMQGLQQELNNLMEAEDAAKTEVDALTIAVEEGTQSVANNEEVMRQSNATMELLAMEYPELAGVIAESSGEMATSVDEQLQIIEQAYNDLHTESLESLNGQIGLFDELSVKCELSTKDMLKNLQSQKKAFDEYADNLAIAMERGVDMGIVQQLSDGSAESMGILAELVAASDVEIENINKEFQEMSKAKDSAADAMAGVGLIVKTGLTSLVDTVRADGKTLGQHTVDGLIEGVKSRESAFTNAVARLGKSGASAYATEVDQHSPSRVYRKLAANDVAGLVVQYKADTPKLKKAAADMADAGYVAAIKARRAAIPSISAAIPAAGTSGTDQNTQLLQQILAETKKRQFIQLETGVVVGATVGAYDEALGQNQILADRGAK